MANQSVRLILAGDVMTGRGIDQILPHPGEPQIFEPYMRSAAGYVALAEGRNGAIPQPAPAEYIWGDALAEMAVRAPNLRIINLETAVTTNDQFWPGKGIQYRMHPANIGCITAGGVHACALANNHVLDWHYTGLAETLATLRTANIAVAGAGVDRTSAEMPAIIPLGSYLSGTQRLLLFAFAHGSSGVPDEWAARADSPGVNFLPDLSAHTAEVIAAQIDSYRRVGDRVLVSIHWGANWGYRLARGQREFAHRLIDVAGVDLVHGHSSHHPQGIEIHRGRPVLYGCGDLINDYEGISGQEEYRPDLRLLYCADLNPRSGELQRLELIPFRMRRFRLQRASAEERDWLHRTLNGECRRLGSGLTAAAGGETLLFDW